MIAATNPSSTNPVTLNLFQGPGAVHLRSAGNTANLTARWLNASGRVTGEGILKRVQDDVTGKNGLLVRQEFAS